MRFPVVVMLFAALLFGGVFLVAQELDLGGIPLDDPPNATETASPGSTTPESMTEPVPASASEDDSSAGETAKTPKRRMSIFGIIHAGGLIGYVIILLSFVSVALMIEHGLSIRQKILMPPGLADEILQLLSQGQLAAAVRKAEAEPSVLGRILYAGMMEYDLGWAAVEKGAEEAVAEEASRLYRKIEYLNVIGNIAPMLGLLGTVVGMVFAFQQLAESEGYARAADLAEGIYLALVTTVEGLIVAIPSLAAFSIFSNRIAFLIAETTYVVEQVLHPIKKSFVIKGKKADASARPS